MELYDSRYFFINKRLSQLFGIWPYDSNRKYFLRLVPSAAMICFMVPHWLGVFVNYNDIDRLMEHICIGLFIIVLLLKLVTAIIAQDKMKIMLDDIVSNWTSIQDEEERNILKKYSERGRLLTIGYLGYIGSCFIIFVFLPLSPIFINSIRPSREPLPRLFLMNAEFLVDRNQHYWKIYFWDLSATCVSAFIVVVTDTTFAACIEHCVGLFAIISHRLLSGSVDKKATEADHGDALYEQIVDIVNLHQVTLRFANTLETAYSLCFFMLMISNIIIIPLICVMVIMNGNQPIQLFRYFVIFSGLTVHLFYLTLAGQRIIDYSSALFNNAYNNDWYNGTKKSKKALRFFMLRCTSPVIITAGGLMIMGMETFFTIMKTSLSYITVLASFR